MTERPIFPMRGDPVTLRETPERSVTVDATIHLNIAGEYLIYDQVGAERWVVANEPMCTATRRCWLEVSGVTSPGVVSKDARAAELMKMPFTHLRPILELCGLPTGGNRRIVVDRLLSIEYPIPVSATDAAIEDAPHVEVTYVTFEVGDYFVYQRHHGQDWESFDRHGRRVAEGSAASAHGYASPAETLGQVHARRRIWLADAETQRRKGMPTNPRTE